MTTEHDELDASNGTTPITGTVSGVPLSSESILHLAFPAGAGVNGSATSPSVSVGGTTSVNGSWQIPASSTPVESGTWTGGSC